MTSPVSSNTFNLFHKLFLNVAMVIVKECHLLSVWKLYCVFVSKQKSLYIYMNKKVLYIGYLWVLSAFLRDQCNLEQYFLEVHCMDECIHLIFPMQHFSISVHCTFCLFIKTYFWTRRLNTLICPHHHPRYASFHYSKEHSDFPLILLQRETVIKQCRFISRRESPASFTPKLIKKACPL